MSFYLPVPAPIFLYPPATFARNGRKVIRANRYKTKVAYRACRFSAALLGVEVRVLTGGGLV